ncbi:MAG: hypothetical protein GY696_08435 [Gammaproteobacteria bacterium]|nr:hypothetical protein [Gammaproteobacteria bacterium]
MLETAVEAYRVAFLQTMKGEVRVKAFPIIMDHNLETMGIITKIEEMLGLPGS